MSLPSSSGEFPQTTNIHEMLAPFHCLPMVPAEAPPLDNTPKCALHAMLEAFEDTSIPEGPRMATIALALAQTARRALNIFKVRGDEIEECDDSHAKLGAQLAHKALARALGRFKYGLVASAPDEPEVSNEDRQAAVCDALTLCKHAQVAAMAGLGTVPEDFPHGFPGTLTPHCKAAFALSLVSQALEGVEDTAAA